MAIGKQQIVYPNSSPLTVDSTLSFISQIHYFNDTYNWTNSEKLCQILLTIGSLVEPQEDQSLLELRRAVNFLWAHALFCLGRYKECLVVCQTCPDYLRCKFLRLLCLEKIESFNECILEAQVLLQNPKEFGFFDILQSKHSMPNQSSVLSLIGTCYTKLGHSFEASKYYKLAFDANSFDLNAFADVVQRQKEKEAFFVCNTFAGENESSLLDTVNNSPASSVNKRLSLSSVSSSRPNTRLSSVQMGISQGSTPKKSKTSSPSPQKSFQRKLFDSIEENVANNQSSIECSPKKSFQPSESFFPSSQSFFYFYLLYLRKEYKKCFEFLQEQQELRPKASFPSTPLFLSIAATSCYESLQYEKAKEYFEILTASFPHFLSEILFYSSTLWHLKDQKSLETLGNFCLESNAQSHVSWICLGNLHSLKKNSSEALKALQKASCLQKYCSYTHILIGYEHLANNELNNSVSSFLASYKLNPDYKALFGISLVAIKESQWEKAEKYLLKAYSMNSTSSVLAFYLGLVYENLERLEEACKFLDISIQLDFSSFATRFKRARLLYKMKKYESSLGEALELSRLNSSEPAVYLLLGRIYKELGDSAASVKYFTWGTSMNSEFSSLKREMECSSVSSCT
jgi:tetratricopeptide (TPR) repeat protein